MKPTPTPQDSLRLLLASLLFPLPALAWRSDLYPSGWRPPANSTLAAEPVKTFYTDPFLQDFSYAGYKRGEVAIPTGQTAVLVVPVSAAHKTGQADATAVIQAAIDTVASWPAGGVVLLPAGAYKVSVPSGKFEALRIKTSHVVLRGEGEVRIHNTTTSMRGKAILRVAPASFAAATVSTPVKGVLAGPASVIPVQNAALFPVGGIVHLVWDFSTVGAGSWVEEHLQGQWWGVTPPASPAYPYVVVARNTQSTPNTLTIDGVTRYTVKEAHNARVQNTGAYLSGIGVENLRFSNTQIFPAVPHQGYGEEDYDIAANVPAYNSDNSWVVAMNQVYDSWIDGVSTFEADTGDASLGHILSNGIRLGQSFRVTIKNCHLARPQYGGGGGNGYLFLLQNATDCLVHDSSAKDARHGFVFSHASTAGNVLLRCVDENTKRAAGDFAPGFYETGGEGSDSHKHFSHSNLYDSCTAINSRFEAFHRGTLSGNAAMTSAHSAFWNTTGLGATAYPELIISRQGRHGYVVGTQGSVTAATTGSNGNTAPDDIIQGAGWGSLLYPPSLYHDQLNNRLRNIRIATSGGYADFPLGLPVTVDLDAEGDATTTTADFTVSGCSHSVLYPDGSEAVAEKGSFSLTYKAAKNIGWTAVNRGNVLTAGTVNRGSDGSLGVLNSPGDTGIGMDATSREGLQVVLDTGFLANSLVGKRRVRIDKIDVKFLGARESFAVVNLHTRAFQVFTGSAGTYPDYSFDVRHLRLGLSEGESAQAVAAIVADTFTDAAGVAYPSFKVKGLVLSLVSAEDQEASTTTAVRLASAQSTEPGASFTFPLTVASTGAVSSSSGAFTLAPFVTGPLGAQGTVTLKLEALASVNQSADPGAPLTVGSIDRDSAGRIGVTSTTNSNAAVNQGEGVAIHVDATTMPAGSQVRVSEVKVEFLDANEGLRIVNRLPPGRMLTVGGSAFDGAADFLIGNGPTNVNTGSLGLSVKAGQSGHVATVYGHSLPVGTGFRVTGLTLEVAME
jgi:hypothetical protein